MRLIEFASAEEQITLFKLITDKVWQSLADQQRQQAEQAAIEQLSAMGYTVADYKEMETQFPMIIIKMKKIPHFDINLDGAPPTLEKSDVKDFLQIEDKVKKEKLEKEKEVMGFYVSAHPLDSYKNNLQRLQLWPFDKALKNIDVRFCGIVKMKR